MSDHPIYAVGDIHGHIQELDRVLDLIEEDGGEDAQVVFLGDLVDRGPESREVVDRLCQGIAEGKNWTVLRGNHDDMFIRYLESGETENARISSNLPWINPRLGGLMTLKSYDVDIDATPEAMLDQTRENVPFRHLEFLRNCPYYFEAGQYLFVHAGLLPGRPLTLQDPEDLMWIRTGFLDYKHGYPWLVIHGHTALEAPEHLGNRVNLDSGAGYGRPLTAAGFLKDQAWTLSAFGRERLIPRQDAYAKS